MHISHVCTNFRIIYSFLWYVTEPHVYSSIPLLDIIFGIQILSHPYQSKTRRFLYTRATFPIEYQPTLQPLWKKIDGWRRRRKRASLLDSESPRRTTTILVHAGPAEISIDKRWEQIQVKIAGERVCVGTRARRVTPRRYICSNASTSSPPAKTRRARTERRRFGENPIKITGLSLSPSLLGRQRGSIAGEEFEREEKKGRKRERRRRQQSAIKIAPFQHCFLSLARARGGDSTAAVARGIYSRQTGWLARARACDELRKMPCRDVRAFLLANSSSSSSSSVRLYDEEERVFFSLQPARCCFLRESERQKITFGKDETHRVRYTGWEDGRYAEDFRWSLLPWEEPCTHACAREREEEGGEEERSWRVCARYGGFWESCSENGIMKVSK